MGRGIQIPNFGIFTFSAPKVLLDVKNTGLIYYYKNFINHF